MYKELKLKANHNITSMSVPFTWVVIKCTKSWSWKQITTKLAPRYFVSWLLSNVQRAEVESKSQPFGVLGCPCPSCYQMYKELKLKANHNNKIFVSVTSVVVIKCTKSWSWKQITTLLSLSILIFVLLSNVQRAEVESKSQPVPYYRTWHYSCYQMYKELKLKANHNVARWITITITVVIKCTKSWSWKQITTCGHGGK